jgi:(1->4)-alpha-D-glucan 1-alpha-D-glucosylmutase
MIPRATYRFQFHRDFTFADAEALVPYLDRLGISHLYASPITTARSGSTHGYDVVDPTRINPELGGEEGFRRLVAALRAHGMGVIVDIVPNHMGVAGGENPWWQDVLARGEQSPFARFFDIDWREKIVLPVLGEPLSAVLANNQITLDRSGDRWSICAYGEHCFPIREEGQVGLAATSDPEALRRLLDCQHYRLASWRTANDALNWRRFFTISELAGLRTEDPDVFEAVHALIFRLYGEDLIDGVRVDHVDGLTDPAGYCRRLRERLDAIARPGDVPAGPAYIVIEKILAVGEDLPSDWSVDGTSGYDFMQDVAALLHDPAGEAPLGQLWAELSGRPEAFAPEELRARQDMLAWQFEGQLVRCVAAFEALARSVPEAEGVTTGMLRRAIERLLWVFPVYRTYGTGTASPASDARIRDIARGRSQAFTPPGEAWVTDLLLSWLAGEGPGPARLAAEAVRRFQQLSAPIAAKAVEDTAFYRYGRLLSRNDVGFDPARFSASIADFHRAMEGRASRFPHALLATATHDHKRGEDVRARLAVLSDVPDLWHARVEQWRALAGADAGAIDPADLYMLFQTLFGAWPEDLGADDADGLAAFAERVSGWQEKALREAKLRSSWEAPDEEYERRCQALVRDLLDPHGSSEFLSSLANFVERTGAAARANMLAQVALRYTVPGVPDLYQGTELPDFSLVDPDNRRPVDYARRQRFVEDGGASGAAKLQLIHHLLELRRSDPVLFEKGGYEPVQVEGERKGHVLAFRRTFEERAVLCVTALHLGKALTDVASRAPSGDWWADTRLVLSSGSAGGDTAIASILSGNTIAVTRISA